MLILKRFLLHYFSAQFIKFLFAGSAGALINWSLRLVFFNLLGISSNISFCMAYGISLCIAFLLYRKLVFPYSDIPLETQAQRFLMINMAFLPIVIVLFNFLTLLFIELSFGEYSQPIAHIFVLGLPALITFLFYKFYAFKNDKESLI